MVLVLMLYGVKALNIYCSFHVPCTQITIVFTLNFSDVDVPKPDEKSIMTYVAQFLKKYPAPGQSKDVQPPVPKVQMKCCAKYIRS